MNSKQQGDIGVAYAIAYYTARGFAVSVPLGDNTRYDLIADKENRLYRVQVKTTRYFDKEAQGYIVAVGTSGGNRSGSLVRKRLSSDEFDLLFVHVIPTGQQYEFAAIDVHGKAMISLKNKASVSKVEGLTGDTVQGSAP